MGPLRLTHPTVVEAARVPTAGRLRQGRRPDATFGRYRCRTLRQRWPASVPDVAATMGPLRLTHPTVVETVRVPTVGRLRQGRRPDATFGRYRCRTLRQRWPASVPDVAATMGPLRLTHPTVVETVRVPTVGRLRQGRRPDATFGRYRCRTLRQRWPASVPDVAATMGPLRLTHPTVVETVRVPTAGRLRQGRRPDATLVLSRNPTRKAASVPHWHRIPARAQPWSCDSPDAPGRRQAPPAV